MGADYGKVIPTAKIIMLLESDLAIEMTKYF